MIQLAHGMPSRKPRPYLSFPRGTRVPSPRLLLYASDLPALAARDLALAEALVAELPGASLVVATGSEVTSRAPAIAGIDVVKVPGLEGEGMRPLERERIRRLRHKLLRTLFDVFLPDVLLLDMVGPEAEAEARLLLERARIFGSAALIGLSHDRPGEGCAEELELASPLCARCRARTVGEVRLALSNRRG